LYPSTLAISFPHGNTLPLSTILDTNLQALHLSLHTFLTHALR
jgi:hypothetical protein